MIAKNTPGGANFPKFGKKLFFWLFYDIWSRYSARMGHVSPRGDNQTCFVYLCGLGTSPAVGSTRFFRLFYCCKTCLLCQRQVPAQNVAKHRYWQKSWFFATWHVPQCNIITLQAGNVSVLTPGRPRWVCFLFCTLHLYFYISAQNKNFVCLPRQDLSIHVRIRTKNYFFIFFCRTLIRFLAY